MTKKYVVYFHENFDKFYIVTVCGIKNARSDIDFFEQRNPFSGLILGGRDASREGEWPWMAFIDIAGKTILSKTNYLLQ